MSPAEHLRHMFLLLCEAREIADETRHRVDPAAYLRERVNRLVAGDRLRDEWSMQGTGDI